MGFRFMIFISFAVLPLLVLILAATNNPLQRGCAAAVVMGVFSLLVAWPWIMLQAVATLIVGFICLSVQARPRSLVIASVLIAAILCGLHHWRAQAKVNALMAMRAKYPLISLSQRLAYETLAVQPATAAVNTVAILSPAVDTRLQSLEKNGRSGRTNQLEKLHSDYYAGFVAANGFGSTRMGGLRVHNLELPDSEPVSIPPRSCPEPSSQPGTDAPPRDADGQPQRPDLDALYAEGIADFLAPERMGYVRDRDQVAGFLPHAFRTAPARSAVWHIARLELVSLLKQPTPVAYVSKNLPRMDDLRNAPTRALDPFEQNALLRLRSEEDLVVDENPRHIRMLGAVRAGQQCLSCHSVARGQLLGAFSYELVPVQPFPIPREPAISKPQALLPRGSFSKSVVARN